jgi:hypothetical protein
MKKEDEFFQLIEGLTGLHTINVHGNISARWIDSLKKSGARVVHYRSRWWREPGMDS